MANPLRVLVVGDDPGKRDGIALTLKRSGFFAEQTGSGEEALRLVRPGAFDAVVADLRMLDMDGLHLAARFKSVDPALPVLLATAFGGLETAREAMCLGAFGTLSKPFDPEEFTATLRKAIKHGVRFKPGEHGDDPVILTQHPAVAETLALARRAAGSKATILVQAESGTGKKLLAKLIHRASPRRNGPFVTINCAAVPETLLESELFGCKQGSSSDAGGFGQADGGTLVLSEISELSPALQAKILRVIQERTVDHLGGARPIPVDVRLIALANRDLAAEVEAGRFREDLFYRLKVIPLDLPPLRARQGDLPLLAAYFAERYARENERPAPRLAPSFLHALAAHSWPGNIRELENAMQRCVVLSHQVQLTWRDLAWLASKERLGELPEDPPASTAQETWLSAAPAACGGPSARTGGVPACAMASDPGKPLVGVPLGTPVALPLGLPLPELERFWLLSTLSALKGNRTRCAERLNIALRTVRNKLNEYKEHGFPIPANPRGRGKGEDAF